MAGDLPPLLALARRSGVPAATVRNLLSDGRRPARVELRVADALVTALGRPEALQDGTLAVEPRSRRSTCCRGSLLGDGSR